MYRCSVTVSTSQCYLFYLEASVNRVTPNDNRAPDGGVSLKGGCPVLPAIRSLVEELVVVHDDGEKGEVDGSYLSTSLPIVVPQVTVMASQ